MNLYFQQTSFLNSYSLLLFHPQCLFSFLFNTVFSKFSFLLIWFSFFQSLSLSFYLPNSLSIPFRIPYSIPYSTQSNILWRVMPNLWYLFLPYTLFPFPVTYHYAPSCPIPFLQSEFPFIFLHFLKQYFTLIWHAFLNSF